MSYRGSSSSGVGDDDPEVVKSRLAEIKDRISILARRYEDVARRKASEQPHAADTHLPNGVPQALAHFNRSLDAYFARRFDQISTPAQRTNGRRPSPNGQHTAPAKSNGQHPAVAETLQADHKLNGPAARDTHSAIDRSPEPQLAEIKTSLADLAQKIAQQSDRNQTQFSAFFETQLAEIKTSLADIAQKIAGQSERNQKQFKAFFAELEGQMASLVGGVARDLREDFDSRIAALTERLYRQILSSQSVRPYEADAGKALLDRFDRIAGLLSDKYHSEAQLLALKLAEQLKHSLSAVSLVQKSDFEVFINEFVDKIDSRLPAIAGKFSAELVDMRKSTKVVRADDDRENAGRGAAKRAEGRNAEVFVKKLQEHLDRRISEITGSNAADSSKHEQLILAMGEQIQRELASLVEAKRGEAESLIKDIGERVEHRISAIAQYQEKADEKLASVFDQAIKGQVSKLGEIDRVVGALNARVDGLMATLAEAERASAARGAALAGSLESTAATLAQKGQAESLSLVQTLENSFLKHSNAARAELAETTALVGSLDDKIAALAEKNRADAELLARRIRLQVEADTLKLAENTRTEIAQTIALVNALESRIAALADNEREDSAALQDSLRKINESTRADAERAIGVVRTLEAKLGDLGEQTRNDIALLANALGERIENQALQLAKDAHASSEKAETLANSLEQKLAAFAQSSEAQSEALAGALHQHIERRSQELAQNTRAEAIKTASFVESFGRELARSHDVSRAENAQAIASLEQKIAFEAGQRKTDSETLAQGLSQQIEHQVQTLAENTKAEAARLSSLVGTLEHTVTALAEMQRADARTLAEGLGQEIAGHVLRLSDTTSAATAETAHLVGTLEDRIAALAEQNRSESASLAQTLSQEIERRTLELAEHTRTETSAASVLFERKLAELSGKVQADTEALTDTLSRRIESSTTQLAENARAEFAKAAALIGSLETRTAGMVQTGFAESAELARKLTQQTESQALALHEKIRAEAAETAAGFDQKIDALADSGKTAMELLAQRLDQKITAATRELADAARADAIKANALIEKLTETVRTAAENGKADTESTRQYLSQQLETRASELAQNARADIASAGASLEQKIAALAKSTKEDSELLAQTFSEQIKSHTQALTENTRSETARSASLFETRIGALAEKAQADAEALTKALTQQIESRASVLLENTKAEAAKTTSTLESKITALADRGQAAAEDLERSLSEQIGLKAEEITQHARTEAEKSSALLQEKITALGEKAQTETASLAKNLSGQIEGRVRTLTEAAQADNAKTTALIGGLDEKIAAFAEKNRVALETQAGMLAVQLKAQLAELIEANSAQNVEVKKLLDLRSAAIVQRIESLNEAGLAEFQRQFKAIDEQFGRGLSELSQQSHARTEALAETLRQRIDLGTTALIEGSRAESIAIESLLRTLTEQVYRKLVVFTDNFRGESATGQKKLDALRESIDRRLDALAESNQDHLARLTELTGSFGVRLEAAEGRLSRFDMISGHEGENAQLASVVPPNDEVHASPPTVARDAIQIANGSATNGAGTNGSGLNGAGTNGSAAHGAGTNGHGPGHLPGVVSNSTSHDEGEPQRSLPTTNGSHSDSAASTELHAEVLKIDDPIDPFDSTRAAALIADPKISAKRKRRLGDLLRLRFDRPKP